jgi:hypothetical protein
MQFLSPFNHPPDYTAYPLYGDAMKLGIKLTVDVVFLTVFALQESLNINRRMLDTWARIYSQQIKKGDDFEFKDMSKQSIRFAKSLSLDCLVVIGGDGTGPEVVAEGLKVLKAASKKFGFTYTEELFDYGGARYLKSNELSVTITICWLPAAGAFSASQLAMAV